MNFENIDDDIDSFHGAVPEIKNSDILFTTDKNVIIGRVTLENDIFWIIPIEPKARTEISQMPLHIIYNSKDVSDRNFIIDNGTVKIDVETVPSVSLEKPLSLQLTPPDQTVYVNILVATDREFFTNEPSWVASAQNIIAETNWVLSNSDIRVELIPIYDATRRNQFSDNATKFSNPLGLFMYLYPPSDLNYYYSDIAIYLGGNNRDGEAQGESFGFTNPPVLCRYAWTQMVEDDIFYRGTEHGRQVVSIHEIGHMFDAGHETRPASEPQYARAFGMPNLWNTVVYSEYSEGLSITHFSSNDQGIFMGDNDHDNSRRISETRDIVASYANNKDKIGIFRPSTHKFILDFNGNGIWEGAEIDREYDFGTTGDIPITGDWDGNGNGITEVGVFRPSTHMFYLRNAGYPSVPATTINWGISTDLPVAGDWDGNGMTEVGVFRPSTHSFYLRNAGYPSVPPTVINWGSSTDLPVTGDWDGGNGMTEVGVFRPSTHTFYLRNAGYPGVPTTTINWGISTDLPVTGDWDGGNGITEVGVFRPSTHTFYLRNAGYPGVPTTIINWGLSTDLPVTGTWA